MKMNEECVEWLGSVHANGYGQVRWKGKNYKAHRLSAYLSGMIDDPRAPKNMKGGGFVLHKCDNRRCINPKHLEVGTYSKNQRDSIKRNRRNNQLTKEQADQIRTKYASGGVTQKTLAREYGVSQPAVSFIIRGERYK